ncbi:hypothetical protein ABVN80_02440 [Acinetobacter baumannii]
MGYSSETAFSQAFKEYLIYHLNNIDKIILVLISMNNKKSGLKRFYYIDFI